MKLSTARVRQTIEQLEEQGAFRETLAISDDSPLVPTIVHWCQGSRVCSATTLSFSIARDCTSLNPPDPALPTPLNAK
jgi:hypothetical protein